MENLRYKIRPCPQCGCKDSYVTITGKDNMFGGDGLFYVSRCVGCGLLFQNPALMQDQLSAYYPKEYGPYSVNEIHIGKTTLSYIIKRKEYDHLAPPIGMNWLERRLVMLWGRWSAGVQLIPTFVPNGVLLEIGCASGNRLALLRSLGWQRLIGIEYSDSAAKLAKQRGFMVHTGRVEDTLDEIPGESLDVVIAGMVMEHLENPYAVIETISGKLKRGGQLLFSTVNIDTFDFAIYKEFWYHLDLPRHFTFFRKSDLTRLLSNSWDVEDIFYLANNDGFVGSARYRAKHHFSLFDRATILIGRGLGRLKFFWLLAFLGRMARIYIHARKI